MNQIKRKTFNFNLLLHYPRIKSLKSGEEGICNQGIYLVRQYTTNIICIEKSLPLNMITNGSAKTEIKLLQKLVHQNIVKYFDSFLDISQGWNLAESSLYMEYCSHGSLFTMLNTRFISQQYFHESEIWTMAFQLINAVDIKAENIFLRHNPRKKLPTLVLGDFGAAIYQIYPNGPFSKNNLQPGAWSSPEWPIFTIHSDTWLVGTVIQFCCYLQRFYHNNDKEIFLGIEKKYSNKLHNFIKKLMEPNITLRTRLNQINLDKF